MLKTMNAMDAGLLAMETPETPMHIGGLEVMRIPRGAGPDYVRKVRDHLMSFPVSGAPFNYRYVPSGLLPGIPAWEVLDKVDLREHVFHHALPWPGSETELFELVSRLDSGLLDRSRPMWVHHLIEGLEGGRYATFTRIHHALLDGKWGVKLAQATTSPDPDVRGLPPFWAVKLEEASEAAPAKRRAEPRRDLWDRGSAGLHDGLESVAELRKAFGRLVESFRRPTDDGLVPLYQAPDCILNGKITARRQFAVVQLDLPRIKQLVTALGAKFNDVVMAICGGGLRRYLLEQGALPKKAVIANMVIAVERQRGATGGNAFAPGMVSLATHIRDPIKRFETVRGSSRHAKELVRDIQSPSALGIFMGVTAIPFALAYLAGRADKAHVHNLVISNVPGLQEKRYLNGALIESQYPLSLLVPGEAMNITVISRAEVLDVVVLVCPDLAPDPQRVCDGIAASLDELERALGKPRASRGRKARTQRRGRAKAAVHQPFTMRGSKR